MVVFSFVAAINVDLKIAVLHPFTSTELENVGRDFTGKAHDEAKQDFLQEQGRIPSTKLQLNVTYVT